MAIVETDMRGLFQCVKRFVGTELPVPKVPQGPHTILKWLNSSLKWHWGSWIGTVDNRRSSWTLSKEPSKKGTIM